jgi:hypothetical protein
MINYFVDYFFLIQKINLLVRLFCQPSKIMKYYLLEKKRKEKKKYK